ncbi:MAG: hypothetical protein AAB864_02140, partial [Patescibacteria group bacterium]
RGEIPTYTTYENEFIVALRTLLARFMCVVRAFRTFIFGHNSSKTYLECLITSTARQRAGTYCYSTGNFPMQEGKTLLIRRWTRRQ